MRFSKPMRPPNAMSKRDLSHVRRVVVKIGTSTLTKTNGDVDAAWVRQFAVQVCALRKQRIEVMVVSSGAIGAGCFVLGLKKRPSSLAEKQAAAAVGQARLMRVYKDAFRRVKLPVAQILLTYDDLDSKLRCKNAQNTLTALLHMDVVPIINENDTVAVEEIASPTQTRTTSGESRWMWTGNPATVSAEATAAIRIIPTHAPIDSDLFIIHLVFPWGPSRGLVVPGGGGRCRTGFLRRVAGIVVVAALPGRPAADRKQELIHREMLCSLPDPVSGMGREPGRGGHDDETWMDAGAGRGVLAAGFRGGSRRRHGILQPGPGCRAG